MQTAINHHAQLIKLITRTTVKTVSEYLFTDCQSPLAVGTVAVTTGEDTRTHGGALLAAV